MRCVECNSEEMYLTVSFAKSIKVNQKGGGPVMSGVKIGQADIKHAWFHDNLGNKKEILGPYECGECSTPHFYVPGANPATRKGDYEEALELGASAFMKGES